MSLVTITKESRLLLKLMAMLSVIGVVIFLGIGGYTSLTKSLNPPVIAGPEEKFGKLTAINLPTSEGNTNISYSIDTVTGQLPTFGDRINVYGVLHPSPNLSALQNTRERLKQLGFTDSETKLSDTLYQWTDPTTNAVIQYDILTNNFDITSPYLTAQLATEPFQKEAVQQFISATISNTLQIDISDVAQENTSVTFYTITGGALQKTDNELEAQMAKIDLYQKEINPFPNESNVKALPIRYPDTKGSTMNFLVSSVQGQMKILEAHFYHVVVDTSNYSTYPLKTIDEAFKDLEDGKGYIVNNNTNQTINLSDVSLAYYMGKDQEYLQPIFIFFAPDFIAYVPAIAPSAIKN